MKTAVYENQLKIMGRTLIPHPDKLIKPSAFFITGFILSQFDAAESLSPFTYSALAACPADMLFSCFCGCFAGYLIKGDFLNTVIRYVTLCVILAAKLLSGKKRKIKRELLFCCITAGTVPALCSAVRMLITGFSVFPVICAASEAALGTTCAFFFHRFFNVPFIRIGINRLSRRDAAFVYAGFFILVLSASGIRTGAIRPVHIPVMFLVLLFSHYRGITAGCICGTAAGAALCLQTDSRHLLALFALGGLGAGIFSRLGQTGCAVAFCCAAGAVTVFSGCSRESLLTLFEAAGVCISFAVIPQSLLMKAEKYLDESGYIKKYDDSCAEAAQIMKASRSINESAQIIEDVFSGMESVCDTAMNRVYADIQQSVCGACEKKNTCWSDRFDSTSSMIRRIMNNKSPSEICCLKTDELCSAAARRKKQYRDSIGYETEKKEMRLLSFDVFRLSASLLEDMAHRIAGNRILDFSKSDMITQHLSQNDIYPEKLLYSTDMDGRSAVRVITDEPVTVSLCEKMKRHISEAAMKSFSPAKITQTDSYTSLEFLQSPYYEISFGSYVCSASDGCECGDSVEYFSDADENAVCVISDGMGTGQRAAIDGVLASSLIKKLLQAGFGINSVLDFVNSAMIVKSPDESLAALDILRISVCTGIAMFCKAGAAPSYIRAGDEIICVSRPSLPAGIIRNVRFSAEEYRLENGNIVLMLSDGVIHGGDEWLREELAAWSTADMNGLACHIASLARRKTEKTQLDDISVAAIRITEIKNKE